MGKPRVLSAGLQLLDRQLVDPDGVACGKVDDLELEERDGALYVTAILCGPGALAERAGFGRLGGWLRRFVVSVFPSRAEDPGRIPFGKVREIESRVQVAVDHRQLATFAGERWVRDHVIGHLPGSGHDAGR